MSASGTLRRQFDAATEAAVSLASAPLVEAEAIRAGHLSPGVAIELAGLVAIAAGAVGRVTAGPAGLRHRRGLAHGGG